ncbi:PASTA domain-containing protein [bacterium]|nr:PASTA domain-containing protein [bacterium]
MKLLHYIKQHPKEIFLGIGSSILLLILFVFVMNHIVMPLYTHHGREIEVPDVEYLSFYEAEEILEDTGFKIIIEGKKFDATFPESTIIFQNPRPFSHVKKGRRIYLTLSAGERLVQVPRLIGMAERDAIFKLEEVGLQVGQIFYEYDNYRLNGVVCNQGFPEGTEVSEQEFVDITVSLGRLPTRFFVPDVVDKDVEIAKSMILQAGLTVGTITYEVRRQKLPDTVIHQSIPAGEEVNRGQSIDLVVSQLEELL